jgi:hypothetical protein
VTPRWATWGVAVSAAALIITAFGVAAALAPSPRGDPEGPAAAPLPTPAGTPYYLVVDLRRVDPFPLGRRVIDREVRSVAESVRETMAGLYSAGFVYRDLWREGRFPSLFGYFTGEARDEARRDLEDLSLGRAARRLSAVRPDRARVNARVLVGPTGHPTAAIALMTFSATGLDGAIGEVPIRHKGRYVLRRVGGDWLIAAYDVRGRVGEDR